jgi:uncharacterized protein (TIGR02246 family)
MPSSSPARRTNEPEELLAIVQDAINGGDVGGFLAAHEEDATVVLPPDGRPARGHEAIRAAITPILAMQPHMEATVVQTLVADDLALNHGRWRLTLTEQGCRSELGGLGTMVARRGGDGTWRIVLDDPLTASGPA